MFTALHEMGNYDTHLLNSLSRLTLDEWTDGLSRIVGNCQRTLRLTSQKNDDPNENRCQTTSRWGYGNCSQWHNNVYLIDVYWKVIETTCFGRYWPSSGFSSERKNVWWRSGYIMHVAVCRCWDLIIERLELNMVYRRWVGGECCALG